MKKDPKQTASQIFDIVKPENVESYTNCLTRLRLTLKPAASIDIEAIKNLPNVAGIITPSENSLQIVLGPGFVNNVTSAFGKLVENAKAGVNLESNTSEEFVTAADAGKAFKKKLKTKHQFIRNVFSKFAQIFAPMIIGFIGAGVLAGIAGIMQSVYPDIAAAKSSAPAAAVSWYNILNLMLTLWKNAFIIIVGWRAVQVFGGRGVLGAIPAIIYSGAFTTYVVKMFVIGQGVHSTSAIFMGIHIHDVFHNWLTVGYRPAWDAQGHLKFGTPSGNILGVLISAAASLWVEKGLRKVIPGALDTILTPTITLFVVLMLNVFAIVPISGYLYVAVAWFFSHLYTNPFGAMFLAGIFLLTVSFGIHQGFIPIYAILVAQTGVNGLFPILAMGGFSQIGTGIAMWLQAEKKGKLRKQIQGALIPAVFGIGEPMIYGVTLPRVKPFITASIGAMFGGFFLGAIYQWGHIIFGLNTMFGPSGILAAVLMTTTTHKIGVAVAIYLAGAAISVMAGFAVTAFAYSKIMDIALDDMKEIYKKNGIHPLKTKIWYSLLFATGFGFFGYITYRFFKLPKAERKLIHKEPIT